MSESGTSFDLLYFSGLIATDITMADVGTDVYVTTNALADTGGILIEDFSSAQLVDQMVFV